MAYSSLTATSMTAVRDSFLGFLSGNGWTTTTTGFTVPTSGTQFETDPDYLANQRGWGLRVWEVASGKGAVVPKIVYSDGTSSGYAFREPTFVHMFAGTDWAALVVEFGDNRYRHLWVGDIDKCGAWLGGCAVSSTYSYFKSGVEWWDSRHKHLFSALQYRNPYPSFAMDVSDGDAGGLTHDGGWRRNWINYGVLQGFKYPPYDGVFGGARDGVIDGILNNSNVPFASRALLVPINLMMPFDAGGGGVTIRYAGSVPGVAYTNCRNIVPGDEFTFGTDTWKVFPVWRKNTATDESTGNNTYLDEENSGWLALAYLK